MVCHASAWNLDYDSDVRIKMCLDVNGGDFVTVHHELGHNYYQRAYRHQSPLDRDGAHDGFHEGIGDTIALSMTPEYLVEVGLLDRAPPADRDIGLLLRLALDKVAFLPFGLLVDQWRWRVFSGEIPPDAYNEGWWDLRTAYQGVSPRRPAARPTSTPAPSTTSPPTCPIRATSSPTSCSSSSTAPSARRPATRAPLHRCSIYGSRAAGERLRAMLELGASRPWRDALELGHRRARDGRHRHPRLLCAPPGVARRAERRPLVRLEPGLRGGGRCPRRLGDDAAAPTPATAAAGASFA